MTKIFYIIILLLIIILRILFILSINNLHPTPFILSLIFYAILICLNISIWSYNFIYSIILFLIIIRGILIIFLYFSSLISNEQNKFYINNYIIIRFLINIIILIYLLIIYFKFNYIKYLSKEILSINIINIPSFINIIIIYKYPYNNFTLLCILYLLISLFTIIKICSIKSASLRKLY